MWPHEAAAATLSYTSNPCFHPLIPLPPGPAAVLRHMARIGDFREAFLSPQLVATHGVEDGITNIRCGLRCGEGRDQRGGRETACTVKGRFLMTFQHPPTQLDSPGSRNQIRPYALSLNLAYGPFKDVEFSFFCLPSRGPAICHLQRPLCPLTTAPL